MIKLKENICWYAVSLAGLLWFCLCFFYRLDRLGINIDESINAVWLLNTIDVLRAEGFWAAASKTTLFMCDFYVGALPHYFLYPFLALGGCSLFFSRLAFFPVAVVFIWLTFLIVRRWFGLGTAALSSFLLCINPVFIRSCRTSFRREEIFVSVFFLGGLVLIDSFGRKARYWKLALAGLLFGLALWAKLMFVAYAAGLIAAAVMLGPRFMKDIWNSFLRTRSFLFGFCPMFVIGAMPLILYNFINDWVTIRTGMEKLTAPDLNGFGANNIAMLDNLWQRGLHLYSFLCRRLYNIDNIEIPVLNYLNVYFFSAAFAAVFLAVVLRLELTARWRRKFMFLLIVYAVVFVLSAVTPRGMVSGHITLMFPFCEIVCALFLLGICAPLLKPFRVGNVVLCCVVAVLFCAEFLSLHYIYRVRGSSFFSPVPSRITEFLRTHEHETAVMSYLLCAHVSFLSGRTLSVRPDGRNLDAYYSDVPYSQSEYDNIRDIKQFYLVTEFSRNFPRYDDGLIRIIREDGREVSEVVRFPAQTDEDFTYVINWVSGRKKEIPA